MKTKTSELEDRALDWAVAKCEGFVQDDDPAWERGYEPFSYSTDWAQGGPLIKREEIELHVIPEFRVPENWADCKPDDKWCANVWPQDEGLIKISGPTPLVAAMRCYVASKLGDDVDVPDELVSTT